MNFQVEDFQEHTAVFQKFLLLMLIPVAFLDFVSDGIFCIQNNNLVYANNTFIKLIQFPRDSLIGRKKLPFLNQENETKFWTQVNRLRRKPGTIHSAKVMHLPAKSNTSTID